LTVFLAALIDMPLIGLQLNSVSEAAAAAATAVTRNGEQ